MLAPWLAKCGFPSVQRTPVCRSSAVVSPPGVSSSRIIAQITRGESLTDVPQDLARRRLYRHRDALDGRIDWNESAVRITDFTRTGNYEPFASPSNVARLGRMGGFDVEVTSRNQGGRLDGVSRGGSRCLGRKATDRLWRRRNDPHRESAPWSRGDVDG